MSCKSSLELSVTHSHSLLESNWPVSIIHFPLKRTKIWSFFSLTLTNTHSRNYFSVRIITMSTCVWVCVCVSPLVVQKKNVNMKTDVYSKANYTYVLDKHTHTQVTLVTYFSLWNVTWISQSSAKASSRAHASVEHAAGMFYSSSEQKSNCRCDTCGAKHKPAWWKVQK